jgi:hypothetical protein
MRATLLAAAAVLLIAPIFTVVAENKAPTAGGSGQSQAAPSDEAKAPVVPVPAKPETAAGSGQSQAAPSDEAKSPKSMEPSAGAGGQHGMGSGCPHGQVMSAAGHCGPK